MRDSSLLRVCAMAFVWLLPTGCGHSPSGLAVITYERPGDRNAGDAAALRGRVESINGCLVINQTDTPMTVLPAFADYLPIPNLGDQVMLGGGFGTAWGDAFYAGQPAEIREQFTVPEACRPLLDLQGGSVFLAFTASFN